MPDDLNRLIDSIEGEGPAPEFVQTLRERIVAETQGPAVDRRGSAGTIVPPPHDPSAAPIEVPDDEIVVVFGREPSSVDGLRVPGRMGTHARRLLVAAAALVVVVAGVWTLTLDDDRDELDTIDVPTTATTTSTQPAPATQPLTPTGECSLAVAPAVGAAGDSVTFDVTFDPACEGASVELIATPTTQGIPIRKNLTLDASGELSISDQLFGSRRAQQSWTVELILGDSGEVAAIGDFAVTEFCDLEASADLQVTHLPDTDEVMIVLTVDPLCAGSVLTFSPEVIGGPTGGWLRFTVDDNGRIEVTRPLLAPGPVFTVAAIEAGGGATGRHIASVTLDIGG